MPAQDFAWWPDDDLIALVSYLRSLPPVDRAFEPGHVGRARQGARPHGHDPARRRTPHRSRRRTPEVHHRRSRPPTTARTSRCSARAATATNLSGGPIPGAPPELPVPANITPHETGIKSYTEADFMRLIDTGIKQRRQEARPVHADRPTRRDERHREEGALGLPAIGPGKGIRQPVIGNRDLDPGPVPLSDLHGPPLAASEPQHQRDAERANVHELARPRAEHAAVQHEGAHVHER